MRILPFVILFCFLLTGSIISQSQHGDEFDIDCSYCHDVENWTVDIRNVKFDHSKTSFPITGQHKNANCKSCHTDMVFGNATADCISCHKDIHSGTTGSDCSVCHTPESWIVKDIINVHHQSRFPLAGNHRVSDCEQCHSGYSELNFEPIGINCIDCHSSDYLATKNPDHTAAGFSTECNDCHTVNSLSWASVNVVHDFFPLAGGHKISNCFACHEQGGNFSGLSAECFACHEDDYNAAQNPNHIQAQFPTDCSQCHSIYAFVPTTFDHNITEFPLTGKHIDVSCRSCHTTGYISTPTECYSCHQQEYQTVTDPNHIQAGFQTTCQDCHTTSGWTPATFDHNLTDFPLTGAHIAVNCSACHEAGYTGTSTECVSCHQDNFNATTNPNHTAAGFPVTCQDCHTTNAWQPAQFDHDGLYFPIYTGKHSGNWNTCSDCHTVQNNFSVFSCIDCHEHNRIDMDDKHSGVNGYIYESTACFSCHPNGEKEGAFDHGNSLFILDGAHSTIECSQCHQSGYTGTTTVCYDCHTAAYINAANPNHTALSIPTDCNTCHSTNPGWSPAQFPIHDQFYILTGRHLEISNDCSSCHNGNYTNTSGLCVDCHQTDYTSALNPNHSAAGIPAECSDCHTTSAWVPSGFNHLNTGFELSGQHLTLECSTCHQGTVTGLTSECYSCHQEQYTSAPDHVSQSYPTTCEMCHNSTAWNQVSFDHQLTGFPLTGGHSEVQCSDCHQSGYTGTSSECISCHQENFQQTSNPDHNALALPTNCQSCHTTNPGWSPALFPDHNNYYQLTGAHLSISSNCNSCHNGNYNNTPNTCIGCHQDDYNSTDDPPHSQLSFSTECLDCHTMNGWGNASFNHSFYPLSGNHNSLDCSQCHSQPNYQPDCLSCHLEDYIDKHNPGDPTDCWNCHTTNDWGDGTLIRPRQDRGVKTL